VPAASPRLDSRMKLAWPRRISLADKCLLLFGGAVLLIVGVALVLPWLRMNRLVEEGQLEVSRSLVGAWEAAADAPVEPDPAAPPVERAGITARVWPFPLPEDLGPEHRHLRGAARRLTADPTLPDVQRRARTAQGETFHYFRAVRVDDGENGSRLAAIIQLDRPAVGAAWLAAVNALFMVGAATIVLALALLVFYGITHGLILAPVRSLRSTAEKVREGDLSTRSAIETRDEFQELAETFNAMLEALERNQEQLRAVNAAMDTKLGELAEANRALYDAAHLKGEFLANVSHELRTPMNSIVGFAELLLEIARAEQEAGDDSTRLAKRIRYLENIVSASRNLLEMINSLLEMAKIEAGKIEIEVAPVDLREMCQGLSGLIQPLADRNGVALHTDIPPSLPAVETDRQRLHHILFNFLSNAVKFSAQSDHPRVTIRAEHLVPVADHERPRFRISVIDNGPGISSEDQERIFHKFVRLDPENADGRLGTGLGLAICRELAQLIQGEIQLESAPGRGSMFSLIIPDRIDADAARERRLEGAFRGALVSGRDMPDTAHDA